MSKNVFVIATRGHALHLAGLAAKKLKRLEVEIVEQRALVEKYEALAPTLPESAAPAVRAKKVYAVGEVVKFNYGRDKTRVELQGVVKAVSPDGGKLKVEVGEGFDAQVYTIFTGAITARVAANGDVEQVEAEPSDNGDQSSDNQPADLGESSDNSGTAEATPAFDADPLA